MTIGCVVRCVPDIADDMEVAAQDNMMPVTNKVKYIQRRLLVADNIVNSDAIVLNLIEFVNFTIHLPIESQGVEQFILHSL